jgi:putative restriction endonuclease
MATRNLWTKEELILAFNLYLKTPFGKMHSTNKDVIHLANLIGRTPNSIALRLVNFASVDPVLKARGIKGMDGGTKIVQPIWDEFYNNQEDLVFQSEQILAQKEMVLANYATKCAITGIDIPQLLLASHIVPWSKNEKERLNPENGICLSPLYDKAFDIGLIGINTNYQIILSKDLKAKKETAFYYNHFAPIENQKIIEPLSYLPRKEFLEYHLDSIFEK